MLHGCKTGLAKITKGYRLPASYVIHTVGPVWNGGKANQETLLADCYRNSLGLAIEHGFPSLAFPAISTGIFRFPPDLAARIAVGTVASELAGRAHSLGRVIFCCFSAESANHHRDAFGELGLV
jgi:O-acetyl-ADP-ribose deacetylase (regulator of RNase III)